MTADAPVSGWEDPVIAFLKDYLPPLPNGEGWEHLFSTAYQIGTDALVAMGHAEETGWGAVPMENPRVPEPRPRWDDICVAVLWLAEQQYGLEYRLPSGEPPPPRGTYIARPRNAPKPPASNIQTATGLGPAHAKPKVLEVLTALGLIADGRWTPEAEMILWRGSPRPWGLDFKDDPRFKAAIERTIASLPPDIKTQMDALVVITDADVQAVIERRASEHANLREQFGKNAQIVGPSTPEAIRRGLEFSRPWDLDRLFYRHWRLSDDWLSPEEAERALNVFHDRLAIEVRKSVMAQLYPDHPFAAQ